MSTESDQIVLEPAGESALPDSPTGKRTGLLRIPAAVEMLAGFLLVLTVMGWIEFAGPAILDNDGYYHIRWSKLIAESFPRLPSFDNLPLTTLNPHDYVDHHYLFHVMLVPFTLGDLRVGAKMAAVFYSGLGIAAMFALLAAYRVPYRWAWLALLVGSSEPFLYRMSMTRAPGLALALLAAGAYLILKRKLALLALLAFAFVWVYSLFPLILMFAGAYTIAAYLAERRIDLGAVAATSAGVLAGLVINPYFPNNLILFRDHLMMKLTANYSVDVGVEWYPYDTWVVLGASAVAFGVYFLALVAFDIRAGKRALKPLFFLILSTAFLLMLFKSRRFIEYWPPFAILFGAFTLGPHLERMGDNWPQRTRDRVIAAATAVSVVGVLLVAITLTLWQARRDVASEADPFAYKGASEWLAANTPPGTLVFNTDWDDFPMLYYYNPSNAYIVGLDPTYLYDYDQKLWRDYERITLGREGDPAPIIRDKFGAEYVFTDNHHAAFLAVAERSGDFETVYKDVETTVLRLRLPEDADSKQ